MPRKRVMGQLLVVTCAAIASFSLAAVPTAHGINMNFEHDPPMDEAKTRTVVDRFNKAFNRHDVDTLASLLTDDTVFEGTSPPPDGQRIEGKAAVVAF